MLVNKLEKAGLSNKEARVYLAALELGETTIARLAQKSGVKRATVYLMVDSLKEKGLLSSVKKKNKDLYFAEDPRILEKNLEEKQEALHKMMPEILSIANFLDKKPTVRYFEGQSGMIETFQDMLNYPDQEILAWYNENFLMAEFYKTYFFERFIPARKKNKIWVRTILPDNAELRSFAKKGSAYLNQARFVTNAKFNLKSSIGIYGKNKVQISSYKDEIGMIIESEDIHDSLKSIFEVMWEGLGA